MEMKTVALLGAGAVGAYFIWGLSDKLGENLWVVADGARKRRLEQEGLTINGQRYALNVRTPAEARGADLLLVATKYGALRGALDDIAAVADGHTVVMSLLNGVNSEEILAERIGRESIVYSLMKIASERRGDEVVFDGPVTPGVFFGEADSPDPSERMLAIARLLDGTPLHYHMFPDIVRQMWYKFALNVSQNLPQAILGVGVGAYEDSAYAARLAQCLRDEVTAVAAAKGADISTPDPTGQRSPSARRARYSTLQDLDAHRHTEVDLFAGAMVEMGRELGIPTPYSEFTWNIIKALEEKNDGKFDY
ncbi:MAG: ketopantoate reductase family protein [Gemmiger sp.]